MEIHDEIELVCFLDDCTTPMWNISPVLRLMDSFPILSSEIRVKRASCLEPPPYQMPQSITEERRYDGLCSRCPKAKACDMQVADGAEEPFCGDCAKQVCTSCRVWSKTTAPVNLAKLGEALPRQLCFPCTKRFRQVIQEELACSRCKRTDRALSRKDGRVTLCLPCAKK